MDRYLKKRSKEEEDFIRNNYTDMSDEELWRQLWRAFRGIRTKRQRMWLFLYFQESVAPIKNEKWVKISDKVEISDKWRLRKDWFKYLSSHVHKHWYVVASIDWVNRLVHLVVWEAFNWKIPEWLEIDHKDCNKLNNALWNLELVTHQENMKRAYKNNCRKDFFWRKWTSNDYPDAGSTDKCPEVPSTITENADGEDIV